MEKIYVITQLESMVEKTFTNERTARLTFRALNKGNSKGKYTLTTVTISK